LWTEKKKVTKGNLKGSSAATSHSTKFLAVTWTLPKAPGYGSCWCLKAACLVTVFYQSILQ
jgi:hypothetical protein